MKKLFKKSIKQENSVKPYCSCSCGCYCRPYENANQERGQSNTYQATTSDY